MEISVNIVRHLLKKVEIAGRGDLLRSAPGYDALMLLPADAMVTSDNFFSIIDSINSHYPDGKLAFDIEYKYFTTGQLNMLGALGQLVQVSPTLAGVSEAFYNYYGKYNRLFAPGIERRGTYMASFLLPAELNYWTKRAFQVTVEMFLYGTLKIIREWFSDDTISPISLSMPYQLPEKERLVMEETFGCRIIKGEVCVMIFPVELYERTLPYANPALWEHMKQYLDSTLLADKEEDVVQKIKGLLRNELPKAPTLTEAAQAVFLSERSLQRKLKDQQTTFQLLLDTVRKEKAEQQLRNRSLTLKEIAFNCGFDDSNSFFRAFKKWTGQTPEQWKANQ